MKEFSSILTTDSTAFRPRICLFNFKKKKVKDCIVVVVSEKGYSLLSYVSPQRNYAPYGKTFYQILWGCIMQRPHIAVRQGPFIKNRKIK